MESLALDLAQIELLASQVLVGLVLPPPAAAEQLVRPQAQGSSLARSHIRHSRRKVSNPRRKYQRPLAYRLL